MQTAYDNISKWCGAWRQREYTIHRKFIRREKKCCGFLRGTISATLEFVFENCKQCFEVKINTIGVFNSSTRLYRARLWQKAYDWLIDWLIDWLRQEDKHEECDDSLNCALVTFVKIVTCKKNSFSSWPVCQVSSLS